MSLMVIGSPLHTENIVRYSGAIHMKGIYWNGVGIQSSQSERTFIYFKLDPPIVLFYAELDPRHASSRSSCVL